MNTTRREFFRQVGGKDTFQNLAHLVPQSIKILLGVETARKAGMKEAVQCMRKGRKGPGLDSKIPPLVSGSAESQKSSPTQE